MGTLAAMPGRIVVFGATGYTGRLVAERLVAAGVRPVLAARNPDRVAHSLAGLETVRADALRQNTVFALVDSPDDAAPTWTRRASRRSSGRCSASSGRRPGPRARGC
jgi:nucleoside-diphosphate-sugar epimerase